MSIKSNWSEIQFHLFQHCNIVSPRWLENFYHLSLDPRFVITSIIGYLMIVNYLNKVLVIKRKRDEKESITHGSILFKTACFIHNVLLTLYSGWTFYHVFSIIYKNFIASKLSLFQALRDENNQMIKDGIGFFFWLFYVSKFYEFLDTLILLLKGRSSNNLQTYHHAGVILTCWLMYANDCTGIWLFVFLNSFIHTLMYFYFGLTTIGIRPSWKKIMTTFQIIQFYVGIIICSMYLLVPELNVKRKMSLPSFNLSHYFPKYLDEVSARKVAEAIMIFYLCGLLVLFTKFYNREYDEIIKNKEKKSKENDKRENRMKIEKQELKA